jgi:hypothetical protein
MLATSATMTDCKSPTHRRFRDASEGLYFEAHFAQQDLTGLLDTARAEDPHNPESALIHRRDKLALVEERMTFARRRFDDAEQAVNAHLVRGCRYTRPHDERRRIAR